MSSKKSHLVSLLVGAGAVAALAVPGVASASGGSLVTITDPSSAFNAKVSSSGQLLTRDQSAVESLPFATFGRAGNNAVDRVVIAGPTTRTVALSSLTVSATGGTVAVRIRAVEPTDGSCDAGHTVTVLGEDLSFVVPADSSHSVEFPSPLVAKPRAGATVCLIAHADTTYVPASGATLTVSGSGYLR